MASDVTRKKICRHVSLPAGALHSPQTTLADEKGRFMRAIACGKVRTLHSFLDSGINVNFVDPTTLRTPLIRAVYIQKEDVRTHVVRMLVRYGCDVNMADGNGTTVLMHACAEGDKGDVVRRVVCTGYCDPNVQDPKGDTALIYAVRNDNPSAIRILVNSAFTKHSLEIDRPNKDGATPLKLALQLNRAQCCKVLVNEGKADTSGVEDKDYLAGITVGEDRDPPPNEATPGKAGDVKKTSTLKDTKAVSKTSLRLEKISLHSRGSTDTEVDPDPKGMSTPLPRTGTNLEVADCDSSNAIGRYSLSPRGPSSSRVPPPKIVERLSPDANRLQQGGKITRASLSSPETSPQPFVKHGVLLPKLSLSPNPAAERRKVKGLTRSHTLQSHGVPSFGEECLEITPVEKGKARDLGTNEAEVKKTD